MTRPKKTKLADSIYVLRFRTQYELASTFLRVQEHYESSRFRNRRFTLEAYMDWYASTFGAFTYFQDWSGFNVPSTALDAFYAGEFDPLLVKEQRLLRMFEKTPRPFYLIGISSDAELRHEKAHALFFTRPEYRREVLDAMAGHDLRSLRRRLESMGYHRAVVTDEAHAYLIDPEGGDVPEALTPLRRTLRRIYAKHAARTF